MEYRQLGQTDLRVSTVAMGCWAIAGDQTWGPQTEADATAAVRASLDAGVNFFDTAEGYGEQGKSEVLLGKALGSKRKDVVIASKVSVSHLEPDALRKACNATLKRLGTDYIDLYQIHWPSRTVPLSDTLGTLDELIKEGKIRTLGVSNFGVGDLKDLLDRRTVASNQLPYSLLWRAIEYEVQPLCQKHNVGILCYSPLAQGLLTGKFGTADEVPEGRARTKHFSSKRPGTRHGQDGQEELTFHVLARVGETARRMGHDTAAVALAWLLHQPAVTSVLAGARNADQARRNAKAGDLQLDSDLLKELDLASDPLKTAFGPEPDMWAKESRFR